MAIHDTEIAGMGRVTTFMSARQLLNSQLVLDSPICEFVKPMVVGEDIEVLQGTQEDVWDGKETISWQDVREALVDKATWEVFLANEVASDDVVYKALACKYEVVNHVDLGHVLSCTATVVYLNPNREDATNPRRKWGLDNG